VAEFTLQLKISLSMVIANFYRKLVNVSKIMEIEEIKKRIVQLVQSCKDTNVFSVKEREIESLIKAGKELKCKNSIVKKLNLSHYGNGC